MNTDTDCGKEHGLSKLPKGQERILLVREADQATRRETVGTEQNLPQGDNGRRQLKSDIHVSEVLVPKRVFGRAKNPHNH